MPLLCHSREACPRAGGERESRRCPRGDGEQGKHWISAGVDPREACPRGGGGWGWEWQLKPKAKKCKGFEYRMRPQQGYIRVTYHHLEVFVIMIKGLSKQEETALPAVKKEIARRYPLRWMKLFGSTPFLNTWNRKAFRYEWGSQGADRLISETRVITGSLSSRSLKG